MGRLLSVNAFAFCVAFCSMSSFAANVPQINSSDTVMEKRFDQEDEVTSNMFAITAYKQNYILPYYYTASPYNSVYKNMTPNDESIKSSEVKYQLSLKVPVWKDILGYKTTLFIAYTQLSYWQAYNKTAFFRETDYQPEIFFRHEMDIPLGGNWDINSFSVGGMHESNGFGNSLERAWNRVYVQATAANDNWMISVKPWYVIKNSTYRQYNPNLANYMGYGEVILAGKYGRQVFALQGHGLVEQGGKHATAIATWSFPLVTHVNGFVQVFSGYGQSLIEYNHRTNSVGVGIALSDFI